MTPSMFTVEDDRVLGGIELRLRNAAQKNERLAVELSVSPRPGAERLYCSATRQTLEADTIRKARELLKGGPA